MPIGLLVEECFSDGPSTTIMRISPSEPLTMVLATSTEKSFLVAGSTVFFPKISLRTLAWLNRNRRLAKDFEATIASATTWIYIASIQLLIRRLSFV
jgi:hypothetical protein